MPPVVESFDVEIPDRWLLSSWIQRQEAQARNPKKVNSVWREFSQLPDDYRFAISGHVNNSFEYVNVNVSCTWTMLHLECMFEKRRRSMFESGSRKEMVGVYLVMKQIKKPIYLDLELEHDRRDSRPRQRSSYEPRHSHVFSGGERSRTRNRRSTRESNYSMRRPTAEDYYYERERERDLELEQERELKRERKREQEQEQEREWDRKYDRIKSRSHVRSPQRMTRSRRRMNDGSDLMHAPKLVSFARTPSFPDGHRRERERDPAPYSRFTLPPDPDLLSPRPDNLSPDRRPSNLRGTRGRSRSPSPRILRRNNTGQYFSMGIYRVSSALSKPLTTNGNRLR